MVFFAAIGAEVHGFLLRNKSPEMIFFVAKVCPKTGGLVFPEKFREVIFLARVQAKIRKFSGVSLCFRGG